MKKLVPVVLALMAPLLARASVPRTLHFSGLLVDRSDAPVSGPVDLRFRIYSQSTGETALWEETHAGVAPQNGMVNLTLGSQVAISTNVFSALPRYLGVKVGASDEMTPRYEIASVPFAFHAETAMTLHGLDGTTCSNDDVIARSAENTHWTCVPPPSSGGGVTRNRVMGA